MNRRINVILKNALVFVLAACMLCGCESYMDFLEEAAMSDVTQETAESEEIAGDETGSGDLTEEEASEAIVLENVLMRNETMNSEYVFEGRLGESIATADILTVTFLDSLTDMPSDAVDVSQDEDGSVMLWISENGEGYDMYIAADGTIEIVNGIDLFWDYVNMVSISFNGCVSTAHAEYLTDMFINCSSLTGLDLSGFDTGNAVSMAGMFRDCTSLTSLNLSNFDTSNVTDMSRMFEGCASLTSLDLSGFDTSNVTDMSRMFEDCASLTSLDLSGFDTSNVTDMNSMFEECTSLTGLDLSSFDTSNVTDMNEMFRNCASLTSLDVSSFQTAAVTDMSSMFNGCSSLESLDLSSFDTGNVTDFGYIISGCPLLSSDVVGGFDTSSASILPDGTDADKVREFENAETAYGEGTYYIFATREDHYTSTYDGSEQYFLSEQVIYFRDGELVYHVYEISDYGKGSCGVDPQTGRQYGYDVEDCEFYLMTVEQVIAALEEDGFTIVTAQSEWRYDEYDY